MASVVRRQEKEAVKKWESLEGFKEELNEKNEAIDELRAYVRQM